jgi:hypothetical protein
VGCCPVECLQTLAFLWFNACSGSSALPDSHRPSWHSHEALSMLRGFLHQPLPTVPARCSPLHCAGVRKHPHLFPVHV